MGSFALSPAAIEDLRAIYDHGAGQFGELQAERYQRELFRSFELLADFPGVGGRPLRLKWQGVYRFSFASHIIIFTKTETGVRIARVLHGRMDWLRLLRQDEI